MPSSPIILVTGPNGFVGSGVCQLLLRGGESVRGAQRNAGLLPEGCESIVVGEINAHTDWKKALCNVGTVVHLAARVHVINETSGYPLSTFKAVNVEGTKRLAECAAKAGVSHFIFVSSIKVNGESTNGRPFTERDTPNPGDPYGISKWESEELLREIEAKTGMSVTTMRPPLVYGPGVKANFLALIKLIERGVPLPFGSIDNKRSLLGLGNLADLICLCIKHPEARGETFVVSDGRTLSTPELARKIAMALGKKPRVLSVNPSVLRMLGCVCGKRKVIQRLTDSLEIDPSKAQRVLGWKPRYSMAEELVRTAEWFYDTQKGCD